MMWCELFIVFSGAACPFHQLHFLLYCDGGNKLTGGEGVRVSVLTIERASQKKALMGRQKGLHSKGCIHIYTHVPFHVFLQI